MNNEQCQWVALPYFLFIKNKIIKYQDALIYITIRSFLNGESGVCCPSYETIADKANVSRHFVMESIKRLKTEGMLDFTNSKSAWNKNNSNRYSFEKIEGFDQIPVSFFELTDLTLPEKGILLCIRQFFVHGLLTTTYSMKKMAHFIGITYKTLYSQFVKLINKGYVQEKIIGKKHQIKSYVLTDRLLWITGQTKSSGINNVVKGSLKVA